MGWAGLGFHVSPQMGRCIRKLTLELQTAAKQPPNAKGGAVIGDDRSADRFCIFEFDWPDSGDGGQRAVTAQSMYLYDADLGNVSWGGVL